MVNPDKRKGLVYVHQSDDGLMHFCWKDRTRGKVKDDLIIFPGQSVLYTASRTILQNQITVMQNYYSLCLRCLETASELALDVVNEF